MRNLHRTCLNSFTRHSVWALRTVSNEGTLVDQNLNNVLFCFAVMVEFNAYLQDMPQPLNGEDLSNKMVILKQLVETNLLKHRTELTDAMLETQREVKSLEILLARQVQETIRVELRKYMDTQSMALRSQAATPAPTYDLRDSIKQLLLAGQINKAFHQALLANDLSLVEFTLRHTDRMQVFSPEGCRLEQKVLLSLIQQISADMSNHNELKQR